MAVSTISSVKIAGIATVVPSQSSPVGSGGDDGDLSKVIASTGVHSRRVSAPEVCTSDLCVKAAEVVLDGAHWDRDTVDLLIFVSQTPDQVLPATACLLHGRLGLGKQCAAFDVNLGCSGYVYGLSLASAHLQAGMASRVLLLVGDTISKITSAEDRSVAYLFGDAGTATLLERDAGAAPMNYITGTDGSGGVHLQVEAGLFRKPSSEITRTQTVREGGNVRNDEQLFMNGAEIFNFTIREIPSLIRSTLEQAQWSLNDVDAVVLHQANQFMINYLAKRMKLPPEKVVLALEEYGNTSSASIPLAICAQLKDRLSKGRMKLLLAGFGVGFSWAAAAIELDQPFIAPVTDY